VNGFECDVLTCVALEGIARRRKWWLHFIGCWLHYSVMMN